MTHGELIDRGICQPGIGACKEPTTGEQACDGNVATGTMDIAGFGIGTTYFRTGGTTSSSIASSVSSTPLVPLCRPCLCCGRVHLPHATFSHAQSPHRSHSTGDMCTMAQDELRAGKYSFIHGSCLSFLLHATLSISSLSLSSTSTVLLSFSSPNPDLLSTYPITYCEDPRQDGTSTEFHSSTGYEPMRIELNRILVNPRNQTIDDQDDIEEIGVKPLSHIQSLVHSAYDSAESIATPPDSDLDDGQLRKVLASPLKIREREENEGQARAYHSERKSLMIHSSHSSQVSGKPDAECVQKREANAQRTQAYHSRRERLMTSSSRDLEISGKLDAMFSCHSESSQNTFSKRDRKERTGKPFRELCAFCF